MEELLLLLKRQNIDVRVENGELLLNIPNGLGATDIIEKVRNNKKELVAYITKRLQLNKNFDTIEKAGDKDYYRLSSAQKRLYFLFEFDKESLIYNMSQVVRLQSDIEKNRLNVTFKKLISRHESLRTSFEVINDEVVQKISGQIDFEIEYFHADAEEIQAVIKKFISPFDLNKVPLVRAGLIEISPQENILIIDMHHIITDGVSQAILEKEFLKLYSGEELPPLRIQYKDYSEWQNSEGQRERIKFQEGYWLKKLEGELPKLELPLDYARPLVQSHEGAMVSFSLSKGDSGNIKNLTEKEGLTLYMVLLSAFNILLSKISGQEDIIVGTPVAGRNHADIEGIVGMFVNTLTIRNEVQGTSMLQDFLDDVKKSVIEAFENQDYQFEDMVEKVSITRDIGRNPIFDVMFNLLDQKGYGGGFTGIDNQGYVHEKGISKFDLTLFAIDHGEQLLLGFEYCTKLFKSETIERFIKYFKQIINQISEGVNRKIFEIEIVEGEERQKLLHEFNDTRSAYPENKTIHALFKEQAALSPETIAVYYGGKKITYRELDNTSDKLAACLTSKGYNKQIVGIIADREIEIIMGILGILKSGNAYLPMDPVYPKERNQKVLDESGAKVVLTNIPGLDIGKVEVLDLSNKELYQQEYKQCPCGVKSTDLAYVIYTSGSTGIPKGVMVGHGNVVNFVYGMKAIVPTKVNESLLSLTTISFDIFGLELYVPLLNGTTMVLAESQDQYDMHKLLDIVEKTNVTVLQLTPSRLKIMLSSPISGQIFKKVQTLLIGGEEFPAALHKQVAEETNCEIYNMYGPTETTIWSTYKNVTGNNSLNIGKPIINTQVYILGTKLELQAIGVVGELYISGAGVSRGYYKNESLTKERFIDNPFNPGTKLYRTGDLARWLPDGNIEFLGRIDHQVKIRGFRIELGEIESVLLKHGEIKECVVVAREDKGDKYLCAYLVIKDYELGIKNDLGLREYLSNSLPDYMVPQYFVVLEELPLNANGKIDRKSLPPPEIKVGEDYVAPSNETEEKLVTIWSEVLNVPQEEISVMANFFSIGGHSLKAVLIINRIRKVLEVEVSLSAFMINSTVRYLGLYIDGLNKKEYVSIKAVEKKEYYSISSVQKRFYIFQNIENKSVTFNMNGIIPVSQHFSSDKIINVINSIVQRHDAFRTFFVKHNNTVIQRILDKVNISIDTFKVKESEVDRVINDFNRSFDLSMAPILRVGHVIVEGAVDFIMYSTHHILSDRLTNEILKHDFEVLINNEYLKPLKLQYKDYAEWQNSKEYQSEIKRQEKYWLEVFKDEVPEIELPTDFIRPEIIEWSDCSIVGTVFETGDVKKIRKVTESEGVSIYMFFFSVINLLLHKITGKNDFVIGSYALGRSIVDLESIVGVFINTLAVRNKFQTDITYKEFLKKCAEEITKSSENQDYQFDDLVDILKVKRKTNRSPIFDIALTINDSDGVLSLEDEENLKHHKKSSGKVDLDFDILVYREKIVLFVMYCDKLFLPRTIDRFLNYINKIINSVLENININISDIKLIEVGEVEKEQREEVEFEF